MDQLHVWKGEMFAVTKYIIDKFQTLWNSLGKDVKLGILALLAGFLM